MKKLTLKIQWIIFKLIRLFNRLKKTPMSEQVVGYRPFANNQNVFVFGHVFEKTIASKQLRANIDNGKQNSDLNSDSTLLIFEYNKNRFNHFINSLKLFFTYKYPKKIVEVTFGKEKYKTRTNQDGFFKDVFPYREFSQKVQYQTLDITDKTHADGPIFRSDESVLRPSEKTKKIIISDIDDTILKSQATSFLKMSLRTLFTPTVNRKTFPEAASAYQKLQHGVNSQEDNLFFYLSSSTWSIYPLIKSFLKINKFPSGCIILQDIRGEKRKGHSEKYGHNHGHKIERIIEISSFYPDYKFILIGDAGQADCDIYLYIAKLYQGRVEKIYIRLPWWKSKDRELTAFQTRAKLLNVELVFFENLSDELLS